MTFEFPELEIENVQDYPRPPIVEAVPQRIRIELSKRTIVDTVNAVRVLETHHPPTYYIPLSDVDCDLVPVPGTSFCEWKGNARYFDVKAGSITASRAAWCYEKPVPSFASIRDRLAFYATKMDACFVGEARVDPQAGTFYGGWITPNLRGMPKGAPGTEFW